MIINIYNWINWKFWKIVCSNKSMEDDKQVSLTPAILNRNNEDDKKQYKSVLNIALKLKEEDVFNIALTGPYGSGKSSILRSLKKDFPQYKYLSLSLATLKSPLDNENNIDVDTLNNRIEYSILQQLIYKEKQDTLYNSRLKRIYHKSNWAQYTLSIAIMLYIVAFIIVFEPSFLKVDCIYEWFSNPALDKLADIIAILYIFIITTILVKKTIKALGNSKLNKLNLKNGEIELKENKEDTSVFNKHMDEIIYFFQVTKYNVVIIEDLDRFNNTEIFLKLREVNQLLNQSKSVGRKIVFIYAVRDDIFFDEERTKFFDYITTVIPIINSSNSAEQLKKELNNKGFLNDIESDVIDSLAFFIDDMRLLKNIVNEYAQYREKLNNKLDQNRLLAMIVYKNYYPKDFADLHRGKGVLYECLLKKNELLVERNRQIDERIKVIANKLQSLEVTHALQEKEIRLIYTEAYRKLLKNNGFNNVLMYKVENNFYTPEDIAESEVLFNTFISQSNIYYKYYSSGYYLQESNYYINFSQIENIVSPDFTYQERLEALREGEEKYGEQIKMLELSRNSYYTTSIQDLLQDIDMQKHVIFKELKVPKLLESFLKDGLINEDCFDYISYFFGISIDKHDQDFILELKLKHVLSYDYQINNVEQCVRRLPDKCYSEPCILNIQIVDYICQHLDEDVNKIKIDTIIQTISRNKKWDFLIDFYDCVENPGPLFKNLSDIVPGLWKVFAKLDSNCLYEAWLRFIEMDHSTKESRNWIQNNYKFLSNSVEKIGLEIIKSIISNGELIFKDINANSESLLEYVVEKKAYLLTPSNVICAFVYYRNERIDTFDNYPLNISILRNCEQAQRISEYIDEHFEYSLDNVFITSAAGNERVEVIIEIINSDDVKYDTKYKYLSKQHNKVSLRDVNKTQWELAMEIDIVAPSWSDIYSFYESQNNVISTKLYAFIIKHIDELTNISVLNDNQKFQLANSVLLISNFEISIYNKLIKIFNGVTFENVDISNLDSDHLKSLLCADMLPYSKYYTIRLRNAHRDIFINFVDKYLNECIEEINLLPTDMILFKYLMRNSKVIGEKALKVVNHFLSHIVWDSELASITVPVVKDNIKNFDYDTEKKILSHLNNMQERLSFLIDLLEKYKDDFDQITELLESLGDPYRNIIDRTKKATIKNNQVNKMLLDKLKTIGYISSYRKEEEKFRVTHKRNN